MTTKHIPARVVHVCDRCKRESTDEKEVKNWLPLNGDADLCTNCKQEFIRFMDDYRIKGP